MRKIAIIISGTLLLASSSFISSSASAAVGRHCAYRLAPVGAVRGGITRARLNLVGCFATFPEALFAGSGGAIRVPRGTTPASLTDRQLRSGTTPTGRASVLIGTEYDLTSFAGGSYDFFASSTCTASTTWQVANVGALWNDRFESGTGFGGCHTNKKFRNTNFGGTVVTCTPTCSNYGALNNQVSSLRWRV
jgi:hypothetical protein